MLSLTARLLLIAAMAFSSAVVAETLKLATIAPEGSDWMQKMRAGAEKIGKRTGRRVTVKFYGGGVQGNDRQVQRKMRTGQLHGGAFTSGAMNLFHDDADIYGLPLVFNDLDEVHYVRKQFDAKLRQRIEDAGYVTFGFAGGGFAYMMSNKPLSTLHDLEGQKVWTPEGDRVSFRSLQALGVAPVTMPITDVLTGLQTDLLDSVTVPPVGAVVLQWHTRLKYITDLPVAYVYAALLIDGRAFARLQAGDQQVVREEFEAIYDEFDANGHRENAEAMQALLDSGLQLVRPDLAEVRSWRQTVGASHQALAAEGVFDGVLLDEIQDLLNRYRTASAAP